MRLKCEDIWLGICGSPPPLEIWKAGIIERISSRNWKKFEFDRVGFERKNKRSMSETSGSMKALEEAKKSWFFTAVLQC